MDEWMGGWVVVLGVSCHNILTWHGLVVYLVSVDFLSFCCCYYICLWRSLLNIPENRDPNLKQSSSDVEALYRQGAKVSGRNCDFFSGRISVYISFVC